MAKVKVYVELYRQRKDLYDLIEKLRPLPRVLHNERIKMYQILSSIIENALKFTEKGSVSIKFSSLNDKICCEIKDTGIQTYLLISIIHNQ